MPLASQGPSPQPVELTGQGGPSKVTTRSSRPVRPADTEQRRHQRLLERCVPERTLLENGRDDKASAGDCTGAFGRRCSRYVSNAIRTRTTQVCQDLVLVPVGTGLPAPIRLSAHRSKS